MCSSRIQMFMAPLMPGPSCTHDITFPLLTGVEQGYPIPENPEEGDDGEVCSR